MIPKVWARKRNSALFILTGGIGLLKKLIYSSDYAPTNEEREQLLTAFKILEEVVKNWRSNNAKSKRSYCG